MPPAIWPRSRNVEQIDLYDPDVIIVCDTDTLQALAPDMGLDLAKPARTVKRGGAVVDVHAWRGKRLLWAPHPAAHLPPASGWTRSSKPPQAAASAKPAVNMTV